MIRKFYPQWLIQVGILLTFALIPVWYRLPQSPIFAQLYVTRFLIFLPMLWSIFWWLVLGLPGLRDLFRSRLRVFWALSLLLLALWGYASLLWGFQRVAHPDVGQTAALQFAVSVLFVVVVACAAPPPTTIVTVLAFDVIWNAAITVVQSQNQGSIGLRSIGEFPFSAQAGASILESGSIRWVRPYGLMPHPNLLAGALLVCLFAAAALIVARRRGQQIVGIAVFGFGWWALLLTFSRAAWGGLVVGMLAVILFLRPHLRRIAARVSLAAAAGVVVAIGLAFVIGYAPLLAARAGEGEESVELRSVSDRLVFMEFAVKSIQERPILGVGIGNFPWRMSYYLAATNYDLRGDNVHHVLLSVAAELGIVGLLLILVAIVCGLIAAFRTLRHGTDTTDHAARLALFAGFIGLLAVGFLDHYPWTQIHFQVAWWGCLAAAISSPRSSPPPIPPAAPISPIDQAP
ncbi:MAG: O-antigen ligase family protein [Chloroflexota bacterium]